MLCNRRTVFLCKNEQPLLSTCSCCCDVSAQRDVRLRLRTDEADRVEDVALLAGAALHARAQVRLQQSHLKLL